jgi:hypothetical protein
MDRDLILSSHQVDFGEDGTTEKRVGVIMDMSNGVAVGGGTKVEGFVIATGTPSVDLVYDVERRRPGTLGESSCFVRQHVVELGFGDSKHIRCQSPWSAGDRWARNCPDVVDSITADFALNSGWASEFHEFGEDAVDRCAASDGLDAGDQRAGGLAGTNNDVNSSSIRLFRQSSKRPKWVRKSTPIMGCVTSATTKRRVKSRRTPKLRLRGSHP